MAYTKLDLTRLLQTSDLINQPYLVERFLRPYFPASIAGRFAGEIPAHPLKREIIATKLVNEMVDLMGSIFVFGLVRDYGVATDKAVRAWIIVDNLLDLAERSEKLKGAARTIPVGAELESFLALERAATNASRWALSEVEPQLSIVEVFSRFKQPFLKLSGEFESYLVGPERERFERAYRDLKTAGEGEEVAHDLARLAFADHLLNVLSVAERSGAAPELAAEVYFQIVEVMDFSSLESTIEAVPSEDRWERRAARQLAIDLREIRNRITRRVLSDCPDGDSKAAVDRVRQAREREFSEAQYLLSEIRALPTISIAALQVAVRSLSQLA